MRISLAPPNGQTRQDDPIACHTWAQQWREYDGPGRLDLDLGSSPFRRPLRIAGRCEPIELSTRPFGIEADDDHGAVRAGDGLDPFGRAPQHEARDAQPGRLALDAARVGDDGCRVELQAERRSIALRVDHVDVG